MYSKILVPVDLAHVERLEKALATAADLAKHYGIPVCYVAVSSAVPGRVAHTLEEFAAKLAEFGAAQAKKYGIKSTTAAYNSHDPAVDLDDTLFDAIEEQGADLVVMASHVPGVVDHLFHSYAGHLAMYAKVSVLVIR